MPSRRSLEDALEAIQLRLHFGDAATLAGLEGSSRDGWDCPSCEGHSSVVEAAGNKSATCGICDEYFSMTDIVQSACGWDYGQAVAMLDEVLTEKSKSRSKKNGT